jgi:mono/diheme cytochrome c family protein
MKTAYFSLLILLATWLLNSQPLSRIAGAAPTATARPPLITPTPAAPIVNSALLAAGRTAYLTNYCGVCHTLAAAGARGVFGPSHEHIGRTAAQRSADPAYRGGATTAAGYLRESIVTPAAYFAPGTANGRHPMPPYAHLPRAEVDALVYFLLQQQ